MTDANIVQVILQGGSFGLVVIFALYLGKYLIPKTIATFEALAAKFDTALDREMARADRAAERREATWGRMVEEVQKLADQVGRMGERLDRLEAGTKEHRAMQMERRWHDDPNYRGPERRREDDKGGP